MILFFDSGVGGLVYLEEFRRRHPGVPVEYLADTEGFPYGERTPDDVRTRVVDLVDRRLSGENSWHGAGGPAAPLRAVVIACNTASVVALAELRKRFSLPFVGVVPAVKPAAALTGTGHIAILATARTTDDPYTDDLVRRFARYCRVTRLGLPRLVRAAEEEYCTDSEVVSRIFQEDVLEKLESSVDVLVLACTHFVRYRSLFQDLAGRERRVVDSLDGVIARIAVISDAASATDSRETPVLLHTGPGPLPDHVRCLYHTYRVQLVPGIGLGIGPGHTGSGAPPPKELEATVLWGANNIFSVRTGTGEIHEHLRIKGKVLPGTEDGEYNPLAPGDRVSLTLESGDRRILRRLDRRNLVRRWNRKRRALQAIAANVDLILVVASPGDPPYRSGFVDRVIVMAELQEIPVAVVLNKCDLTIPKETEQHLAILESLGYPVYRTISEARTQSVIPRELIERTSSAVTVLVGRSGVGKSSLINCLVPEAHLATGEISRKYSRGRHTTTLARQVIAGNSPGGGSVYIDTPGVRDFDLIGYSCSEVAAGFREFLPLMKDCRLPGCTHLHEPDCAVQEGIVSGAVDPERYNSYRVLAQSLQEEYA